MKRIGVSGGTAPFFRLKLKVDGQAESEETDIDSGVDVPTVSPTRYIGKDLSRAEDEVNFYESILQCSPGQHDAIGSLCNFLFPYLGILQTTEEKGAPVVGGGDDSGDGVDGKKGDEELKLLVLENLFDGKKKLRLLDLKIGSYTAAANWRGKSRFRAWKQRIFDSFTNSAKEGYRLEGFDGAPAALNSLIPFLQELLMDNGKGKLGKKARRLLYQQIEGTRIFMHLLDLHMLDSRGEVEEEGTDEDIISDETYDVDEYLEITMHEIVILLTKLASACHKVTIPQKWIGSSLAIGYDCGEIPKRAKSEEDIRKSTIVKIFDWGRSELNDTARMKKLSEVEVKDRKYFWEKYKEGIDTISFIASHKYHERFCCTSWKYLTFSVFDNDGLTEDDFLCGVTTVLEDTDNLECPLITSRGRPAGFLTYSIKWKEFDQGSRLKGAWKVKIICARDLPNADMSFFCNSAETSDSYVVLRPAPHDDHKCDYPFEQVTAVKHNTINPQWNETFSIPVCREGSEHLKDIFNSAGLEHCNGVISSCKDDWVKRL